MATFDGSLARTFDFGDSTRPADSGSVERGRTAARAGVEPRTCAWLVRSVWEARLHAGAGLVPRSVRDRESAAAGTPAGEKYRALEHRRRQAQIRARRLLAALP